MTYTSSPMATWYTELSPEAQAQISDMVNNEGYPLDDIEDFVSEFGAAAFLDGHYIEWEKLQDDSYSERAIRAFVKLNGITELTKNNFIAAYVGKFFTPADFAESMTTEQGYDIPDCVVVDWEATYDEKLSDEYEHEGEFYFHSTW